MGNKSYTYFRHVLNLYWKATGTNYCGPQPPWKMLMWPASYLCLSTTVLDDPRYVFGRRARIGINLDQISYDVWIKSSIGAINTKHRSISFEKGTNQGGIFALPRNFDEASRQRIIQRTFETCSEKNPENLLKRSRKGPKHMWGSCWWLEHGVYSTFRKKYRHLVTDVHCKDFYKKIKRLQEEFLKVETIPKVLRYSWGNTVQKILRKVQLLDRSRL